MGFTGNSLDAVLVSIQDGFIPTIGKTVGGCYFAFPYSKGL